MFSFRHSLDILLFRARWKAFCILLLSMKKVFCAISRLQRISQRYKTKNMRLTRIFLLVHKRKNSNIQKPEIHWCYSICWYEHVTLVKISCEFSSVKWVEVYAYIYTCICYELVWNFLSLKKMFKYNTCSLCLPL